MAYVKHNFEDGQILNAQAMNEIEDGIVENNNSIDGLQNGVDVSTDIDFNTTRLVNKIISGNGEWATTGSSYLIPISEETAFYILTNLTNSSFYTFLKSDSLDFVDYCENCSRVTIIKNTARTVDIPEDCRFICITNRTSASYLPQKFTLYKNSVGLKDLNKRVIALEQTKGSNLVYYAIGDSITRGMYANEGSSSSSGVTSKPYAYWVATVNGFVLNNLGVSGSGYANRGGNTTDESGSTNIKNIVDENDFSDANIITIAYGINDYKGDAQNISLGSMASASGDDTVVGNMKYAIEKLNEKCPKAQIIILLPMNQNRHGNGTFDTNWSFGYAFRENKTLADYRNAIKECADFYNLKVVDQEEVCPINRNNIRSVLGDGLHPTVDFHKQMGYALANYIH